MTIGQHVMNYVHLERHLRHVLYIKLGWALHFTASGLQVKPRSGRNLAGKKSMPYSSSTVPAFFPWPASQGGATVTVPWLPLRLSHVTVPGATPRPHLASWEVLCNMLYRTLPSQQCFGPGARHYLWPVSSLLLATSTWLGLVRVRMALAAVSAGRHSYPSWGWKQQQAFWGQPLDVVLRGGAAKKGIYGWSRSKETGQFQARYQAAKTLKLRREELWDQFYTRQHGSQGGEVDGQ